MNERGLTLFTVKNNNSSKTLYKDKKTGEYIYLLDKVMEMAPHTRITTDGIERILTEAVQTSYRRGGDNVSIDETSIAEKLNV